MQLGRLITQTSPLLHPQERILGQIAEWRERKDKESLVTHTASRPTLPGRRRKQEERKRVEESEARRWTATSEKAVLRIRLCSLEAGASERGARAEGERAMAKAGALERDWK